MVAIQHQDAALVSFVGRLASDPTVTDGPVFQTVDHCWVVVGDKDVLPALEMGIRFAKCGATVAIWSHSKFAYGPGTRTDVVSADANVRYEVTVHRVRSLEEQQQQPENNNRAASEIKLELCRSKKDIANDIYRNENVATNPHSRGRALRIYKRAAEELEYLVRQQQQRQADAAEASEDDKEHHPDNQMDVEILAQARELLLDCLNNIAAVHLQCKEYHAAKESCVAVLEQDPDNFKALLRAAKAALLDPASSYEEVDAAIRAAAEQCRDDEKLQSDVQKLKMDFHRRKQAHEKRERNMYKKMSKATVPSSSTTDKETKGEKAAPQAEESADAASPSAVHPFIDYVKHLPWGRILPYAFQLSLPLLMYYYLSVARQRQRDAAAAGTTSTTTIGDQDEF